MFNNFRDGFLNFFKDKIDSFGGGRENIGKYKFRENTHFDGEGAFFGCIRNDEPDSGPFSDLSIVIFPSNENNNQDDRWIVALGVGTEGFKNDFELVSIPGTRRLFVKYLERDNTYVKNDFANLQSYAGLNSFLKGYELPDYLKRSLARYKQYILACTILNPTEEKTKQIVSKYLAIYAKLREWPTNEGNRRNINNALNCEQNNNNDLEQIKELLERRKYVVLQGAPGTGKTRLAKMIPTSNDKVFFTQFHAETTYSDFVYGIRPSVNKSNLSYEGKNGVFANAIHSAITIKKQGSNEKVFLIIDEINRANLSNVLGPSFYLFEPNMADSGNEVMIEICPGVSLDKLPDNFYVIATMNTADRSLAVVDFALRRRFAWYTLYPHQIEVDNGFYFAKDEFNEISEIFEKYATDEELNLQPGHAYFIVSNGDNNKEEIKNRLRYEVMPLIKEYILDGMLSRAKDVFIDYFRRTIGEEMFK